MGVDSPQTRVDLQLLGSFSATNGSRGLTGALSQPKRLALVAWLALSRPPGLHRRDVLCALLWPESPDGKARTSLRQLLWILRQEVGNRAIVIEGDLIGINADAVSCDATRVLDALGRRDDRATMDLYSGELLPGFHLPESPAFSEWLDERRLELRQGAIRAAWRLAGLAESRGDCAEALQRAERAMTMDPEDEAGLRRAITLRARVGDRAGALRAYEEFSRRLERDWGANPDSETVTLVEQIRAGMLPGSTSAAIRPVSYGPASQPISAGASPAPDRPKQVPSRRARLWPWLLGTAIASAAAFVASRQSSIDPTLVENRVLVAPFANLTGNAALDPVGIIAADWVIQALQRSGLAEVVDPATAFLSTRDAPDRAPTSMTALRELARGSLAGLLVVGSVASVGDSVEYSARLIDARNGRVLRVMEPVRASGTDPAAAFNEVRSRLAGAVASHVETPIIPLAPGERAPTLAAYQEFVTGLNRFVAEEKDGAAGHFRNAIELDSSFTLAMIWLTYALGNAGAGESRAVVDLIAAGPDRSTPLIKAWLEVNSLELSASKDLGISAQRRAARLSPGSHNEWNLVVSLLYLGQVGEAAEILRGFDLSDSWFTRWEEYWYASGLALHALGDYEEEVSLMRKGRTLHPHLLMPRIREITGLAALGMATAVQARVDSLLGDASTTPGFRRTSAGEAAWMAAQELEGHGHLNDAILVLERSLPLLRRRTITDTSLMMKVDFAMALADLASYRGDSLRAVEARGVLESALPDERYARRTQDWGGYVTAVCAEGDSARIAGLSEVMLPSGMTDYDAHLEAQIAACRGDQEGALSAVGKRNPAWMLIHTLPVLAPIRQDPRYQQALRPKG